MRNFYLYLIRHGRRVTPEERVAEDLNPRHLLVMVQHEGAVGAGETH